MKVLKFEEDWSEYKKKVVYTDNPGRKINETK